MAFFLTPCAPVRCPAGLRLTLSALAAPRFRWWALVGLPSLEGSWSAPRWLEGSRLGPDPVDAGRRRGRFFSLSLCRSLFLYSWILIGRIMTKNRICTACGNKQTGLSNALFRCDFYSELCIRSPLTSFCFYRGPKIIIEDHFFKTSSTHQTIIIQTHHLNIIQTSP